MNYIKEWEGYSRWKRISKTHTQRETFEQIATWCDTCFKLISLAAEWWGIGSPVRRWSETMVVKERWLRDRSEKSR